MIEVLDFPLKSRVSLGSASVHVAHVSPDSLNTIQPSKEITFILIFFFCFAILRLDKPVLVGAGNKST